ncbi:MAG: MerC family mercury resistance protein [Cyclobacteriaceae bacterium]
MTGRLSPFLNLFFATLLRILSDVKRCSKYITTKSKQTDILGIISAGLRIVHCLLVPLLIVYGVSSEGLSSNWEHLDWGFIILSGLAVILSTRHEKNQRLAFLMSWYSLFPFCFTTFRYQPFIFR